jgi:hypothetical protein
MNLTDAAQYDDALTAVLAGLATEAQAKEIEAVAAALMPVLTEAANKAREAQRVRAAIYAVIPAEKREAIVKVLEGDNPAKPRIELPPEPVEAAEEAAVKG